MHCRRLEALSELFFDTSGKAYEQEMSQSKHESADMAGWLMWSKTRTLEYEEARIELYWFELHGSCLFCAKSKEAASDGCYVGKEINLGGADVQLIDPTSRCSSHVQRGANAATLDQMRLQSRSWRMQHGARIDIQLAALSIPIHLVAAPESVSDVFSEQHTMEEWAEELQAAARNFKPPVIASSLCEMTRNLAPLMNRPIELALYVASACRTMAKKKTLDEQVYVEMTEKFEGYATEVMDGCHTMMEAEAVLRGCGGHLFDLDVYTFAEHNEMKDFLHCRWVKHYTEDMWTQYDLQVFKRQAGFPEALSRGLSSVSAGAAGHILNEATKDMDAMVNWVRDSSAFLPELQNLGGRILNGTQKTYELVLSFEIKVRNRSTDTVFSPREPKHPVLTW